MVETSVEDAFTTFTDDIDSWWPRSHHIGKAPMRRIMMESCVGGRCYSEHEDDTECDFGSVLEWEPPYRVVFSWQITHSFGYEPDARNASEVEVRFLPEGQLRTRVEVEHRFFDRHQGGAEPMRTNVDAPTGWTLVLSQFSSRAARQPSSEVERE